MMRIVGYTWASKLSEEDISEPDDSTKQIKQYFKKRKWVGPIQLEDPKEMLVEFHKRIAGQDLMTILQPGDVIVVPDQSFLFSTATQGILFIQRMRQRRIAVHCINHGGDIIYGKLSDIFLMILAPLAQIEPFLPGKRARAIKQKARVEGRYLGGKTPIGFQIGQNGRLVSDGSFKDITRQVLRLKAKGLSLRMIALTLQNKGIKISHTAVDRILKSLGYRHKKEPYL